MQRGQNQRAENLGIARIGLTGPGQQRLGFVETLQDRKQNAGIVEGARIGSTQLIGLAEAVAADALGEGVLHEILSHNRSVGLAK